MKILLIVVSLLFIGGGWFYFSRNNEGSTQRRQESPEVRDEAKNDENKGSSVVASIKDAMGLGEQMQCTYVVGTPEKAITTSVFVDGKKFKTEAEVGGAKTEALFDGETQYVWTDKSSSGMKMTKDCLSELKASLPQGQAQGASDRPSEDYQKDFDMAQNVHCEKAAAVDFSVPKDVEFIDQCALMEQSKKMMEQVRGMAPVGTYPGQ